MDDSSLTIAPLLLPYPVLGKDIEAFLNDLLNSGLCTERP